MACRSSAPASVAHFHAPRAQCRSLQYTTAVAAYSTRHPHISASTSRLAIIMWLAQCSLSAGEKPSITARPTRNTISAPRHQPLACRSEEHTSELQSLMRISYAVFCLKKKNKTDNNHNHENTTAHTKSNPTAH